MNTVCTTAFHDIILKCPESLKVKALLEVGAEYTWVITDKFGNQYQGTFASDTDGFFEIPIADLPDGLLTEWSGEFSLRIFPLDNTCNFVRFLAAKYYDEILFHVEGGTRVKDNLGCEFIAPDSTGVYPIEVNDNFTGNGSQTIYTTSSSFVAGKEKVFVGGLLYTRGDEYTVTGGNTITFLSPIDNGVRIRINY